jgi:hypothetical protein
MKVPKQIVSIEIKIISKVINIYSKKYRHGRSLNVRGNAATG